MIREVTRSDPAGLLALYEQLHSSKVAIEPATQSVLWERILQDKSHHIIVAKEEGKIPPASV